MTNIERDFRIQETGSNFVLLHPLTEQAGEWLAENVDPEAQWWGTGLVVEHRYLEALIDGIHAEGFVL